MTVVAWFKLVFDDDRPTLLILCVDVEPELTDGHLGGNHGQLHTKLVTENVDVLASQGVKATASWLQMSRMLATRRSRPSPRSSTSLTTGDLPQRGLHKGRDGG